MNKSKEDKVREFLKDNNIDLEEVKEREGKGGYVTTNKEVYKKFKKEFNNKENKKDFKTKVGKTGKYGSMFDFHKHYYVEIYLEDYRLEFVREYIWINRWDKPSTNISRRYDKDRVSIYKN